MDVAATLADVRGCQSALYVLATLGLYEYQFPPESTIYDNDYFDYIIIGGGSAGCVLGSRLSEDENKTVLVVEAGKFPSFESHFPGTFIYQPTSYADWNLTTEDDGYSYQNLQGKVFQPTAGKMLGGSSSLNHMMHSQGHPYDYHEWSLAANDSSWEYAEILKYYKKSQKLVDPELLNSRYKNFHGVNGYINLRKQFSDETAVYFDAMKEVGFNFTLDYTDDNVLGVADVIYNFANEQNWQRHSNALAYLEPAKNRTNLYLLLNTLVTRINFDTNNTAISVEALTESNEIITIKARKEIILSAGTFNTPKVLMQSGIGPKDHLESFNIPVVSDLPVGYNLQDHHTAVLVFKMKKNNATTPKSDPHKFPVPTFINTAALNGTIPDYQTVNLLFPHDSSASIMLFANAFKYTYEISQTFYDASKGHDILTVVLYKLRPKSRGRVSLSSIDPKDNPVINMGTYSNKEDLHDMALYLMDSIKVLNSSYFTSVGAELVVLNLPNCANFTLWSYEYFYCYALEMSSTPWHFCGTAALGSVVNHRMQVYGVHRLRVVDASAIPSLTRGKLNGPVVMMAEKTADMIKADSSLYPDLTCTY